MIFNIYRFSFWNMSFGKFRRSENTATIAPTRYIRTFKAYRHHPTSSLSRGSVNIELRSRYLWQPSAMWGETWICYLWTSGSFVDMCEVNFSVASFGFISEIIFFFSFHFKHITIRNLIHKIFNINSDDITSVRTRRKLIKWDPFPFPGDELYNLIKIRF